MRAFIATAIIILSTQELYAQSCCSGGSGSPIAGGTSQGVLDSRQAEIGLSFQYINSKKFLTEDKKATDFLDNYNSKYLYTRLAYGVTSRLTVSLETGYYFNKTQVGLNKRDTITGKGIGDFIIFPRYSIYTHNTEKTRTEITIGLGMKIPIGHHLDSTVVFTDQSGKDYYTPKPPAVMPTSGSNDFIFYGFLYRAYPAKKFRVFSSLLYVKKGWNSLGQRFGDYASIGLFAGKTFFDKLGVTVQLKGEWIDQMKYDKKIDMLAMYNLDVKSTGGKRLLFVPQLSYSYKSFSTYILTEIPLYQYVNGTAIASEYLFTLGLSYRFLTYESN
jgi:hypothetical protein